MKKRILIFYIFLFGISWISFAENSNPLLINDIKMDNFKEVPYEIIEKDLKLKKNEVFTTKKLRKDYKTLKENKYIKDFRIYPEIYSKGLRIVIEIEEVVDAQELLENDGIVPLSDRDRLDRSLIVKEVKISGNKLIPKEIIEEKIDIKVGGYFSRTKVLENRERILATGFFTDVSTEAFSYQDGAFITFNVIENPVIKGIKISGNTLVDTDTLLETMETEIGKVYNINTLAEDRDRILKHFSNKGYMLASIYDMQIDDKLNLVIKISEGVINDIKYKMIKKTPLDEAAIAELGNIVDINFRGKIDGDTFPGGQARNFELELGSGTFIPGFEEQIIGRFTGDEFEVNVVFPDDYPDEELAGKPAVFEVTLNEIKEVETEEGAELKTKEFVIDREIILERGEAFKIDKFQSSIRNLYRLGYFKEIKHEFERIENNPNAVNLILLFDENKTGTITGGVTYSSGVGLVGNVSIEDKNFLGKSQSLGVMLEIAPDSKRNIELNFADPWVKGTPKLSYSLGLYNTNIDSTPDIKVRKIGARGSIGIGLTQNTRVSLGTKYETTETEQIETEEKSSYQKWSINPVYYYDDRDNILDATKGSYSKSSIEYGILTNNPNYTKLQQEFRKYHQFLIEKNFMAYRMVIGGTTKDTPNDELFGVGGSNTLRGYDFWDYQGTHMGYINIENRYRIEDNVQLVLFCDVGRAWENFDRFIKVEDIQASYGAGFRLDTPLGQFRLDYGVPLTKVEEEKKGKWHFSIGQLF